MNGARQRPDPHALLNWMGRLIRTRRDCPELGRGTGSLLDTHHPAVFAHRCHWAGQTTVAVHNLSDEAHTVRLDLAPAQVTHVTECFSDQAYASAVQSGHGFRRGFRAQYAQRGHHSRKNG